MIFLLCVHSTTDNFYVVYLYSLGLIYKGNIRRDTALVTLLHISYFCESAPFLCFYLTVPVELVPVLYPPCFASLVHSLALTSGFCRNAKEQNGEQANVTSCNDGVEPCTMV